MRLIFNSVVLLTAIAASVQADPVAFLSDTRNVSVSISTSSAFAESPHEGATNQPGTPFNDPHLSSSCNVGWQEVNGWTAAPTTGAAAQDITFSANQITVMSSLSVNVGGDPFGFHFPEGASGTVHAAAFFEISFFVGSLTDYQYSFDFSPSATLESATLTLASQNHGTQQLFGTSGLPVGGVLEPDTYTLTGLLASSATGAQAGNNFSSFTIDFTPAPEPTTGALLVVGGIMLGYWRRKVAGVSKR